MAEEIMFVGTYAIPEGFYDKWFFRSLMLIILISLIGCLLVTGCTGEGCAPQRASDEAAPVVDPLIAHVIERYGTGTKGMRGEIIGYLVDYTTRSDNATNIIEVVVHTDGSVYRPKDAVDGPLDNGRGLYRPMAAFGNTPGRRLGPESPQEAARRTAALETGRRVLEKYYDEDLSSTDPLVFHYLIRLEEPDRIWTDIWVEPDGSSAGLYPLGPEIVVLED